MKTTAPALPKTGYIRITALSPALSMSKSTLWRKSRNGTFPKPYKISSGITAWKAEDVQAWRDSVEAVR